MINIAYFFNPFLWIASKNLHFYRELICDETAMKILQRTPEDYGRSLYKNLEACFLSRHKPLIANGLILSGRTAVRRFEYLFNRKEHIMLTLTNFQKGVIIAGAVFAVALSCKREQVPVQAAGLKTAQKIEQTDQKPELQAARVIDKQEQHQRLLEALKLDQKQQKKQDQKKNQSQKQGQEIPPFLPLKGQPRPVGGQDAIKKRITYPDMAVITGKQRLVRVKGLIGTDGTVEKTVVLKDPSGGILGKAVADALKKSKFTPARQKGKPVKFWYAFNFRFQLEK